jgi:hypothetical protein
LDENENLDLLYGEVDYEIMKTIIEDFGGANDHQGPMEISQASL